MHRIGVPNYGSPFITMIMQFLSLLVVTALLCQGCASQFLSEQFLKGEQVREVPSGALVERSRMGTLELLSPCSVRVGDRIERQQETNLYFQKLRLRKMASPLTYPYLDAYLKVLLSSTLIPLLTPSFWVQGSYAGPDCRTEPDRCSTHEVSSVVAGEYVLQSGSTSVIDQVYQPAPGSTVSIFMNGYYQGEVLIGPQATAAVAIPRSPTVNGRDLKITFKYGDAYAYSLIRQSDIEAVRSSCLAGSIPVAENGSVP